MDEELTVTASHAEKEVKEGIRQPQTSSVNHPDMMVIALNYLPGLSHSYTGEISTLCCWLCELQSHQSCSTRLPAGWALSFQAGRSSPFKDSRPHGYFPTARTTKLSLTIAGRCLGPDCVPAASGANSAVGK
jgi:hypothetical protein